MKTVIEMAQEAGFPFNKYGLLQGDDNGEIDADAMLKLFAALVRAAENEACALLIEENVQECSGPMGLVLQANADAIRVRIKS